MRYLVILIITFIAVAPAYAAYQNPVIVAKQVQDSGFIKVTFEFSGNAGEPTIRREYLVRPTSTATHVREWIHSIKEELNFLFSASNIPQLQVGQTIPALVPTEPTPTACEIWKSKLVNYTRVQSIGITAATSDLNALKTDLENTYPAGCVSQ